MSNAKNQTGQGLGLYIARQIMIKQEGDIYASLNDDIMNLTLVFKMILECFLKAFFFHLKKKSKTSIIILRIIKELNFMKKLIFIASLASILVVTSCGVDKDNTNKTDIESIIEDSSMALSVTPSITPSDKPSTTTPLISETIIPSINSTEEVVDEKKQLYTNTMISYIDKLISDTPSYIPAWNMEGFKGKWNYIDGVFLNAIAQLYDDYKDKDIAKANKYKDFLITYLNYYIDTNGNFKYLGQANPDGTYPSAFNENELDTICESKVLFKAYELTNDSRYLTAINTSFTALISMSRCEGSSNFWHKKSYPNQIWLDGMYMYGPFYAQYASENNNSTIFIELKNQYSYIKEHMRDSNTGLYYHGYDSTKQIFWANSVTGCSSNFWLRSMGWFIVSLADVIEYYPNGSEKTYLIDLYKDAIDSILKYQDNTSKMFYQLVNLGNTTYTVPAKYLQGLKNTAYATYNSKKDTYTYTDKEISNYLESSGSSMIAYAILKGYNNGYLDSSYKQKGKDIFEGVYNHSFINNKLNDICITAGLGPESNTIRDGSIYYYLAEKVGSNDAKGVGPFIMAFTEYINVK